MKNLIFTFSFFLILVSGICLADNGWVVQNSGTRMTSGAFIN